MTDKHLWIFGAFAFAVAIGALYKGDRLVLILAGAAAIFLFWFGWRTGAAEMSATPDSSSSLRVAG